MSKLSVVSSTALSLAVWIASGPSWGQSPRSRDGDLKQGQMAPDFSLSDTAGENQVTLSALRGKPVVLIFGSCT